MGGVEFVRCLVIFGVGVVERGGERGRAGEFRKMSSDALSGTVEVIEPSPYFAAESRQTAMNSFSLLGPPDLVTVKKECIPTFGKLTEQVPGE